MQRLQCGVTSEHACGLRPQPAAGDQAEGMPKDMPRATDALTSAPGPTAPASDSALPETYEEAVAELEGLLARLESGQLPLEELLGAYQRATALLDFCRGKLDAVEQQIRVVDGGQTRPWEPGA
jgi:exodeoxyribonuclease VII small subunit